MVLWTQRPWGKPRIHGHGPLPRRGVSEASLGGPSSFSAFRGWEGRRAPSFLWELQPDGQASNPSCFQLPRGEGEQGRVLPPPSSRTTRSRGRPALQACLRVSGGCGKKRQRGSNGKMEGERERGWGGGEAPPFFSLLFLGI